MRNTLKAYERLKREQHIDTLFRHGKAFSFSPLRFIYIVADRGADVSPVRAGFSVPKKKFRRSVHRHRILRLMREAWRQNKQQLYSMVPADKQLHIFFVFTGTELPEYNTVLHHLLKGIERLQPLFKPADA
ncbi:MAG: ribonuclease P protein component [Bacteroidetes bacterium]|nr:ribonuclease P protein component [Bacteroidota bacterium]